MNYKYYYMSKETKKKILEHLDEKFTEEEKKELREMAKKLEKYLL